MFMFNEGDVVRDRDDENLVGVVLGTSDDGDVLVDWGSGTAVVPEVWLVHG